MQFIRPTWAGRAATATADGVKDPNNVYDAALAAGHYLCRNNWNLSTDSGLHSAILSYNNSTDYLNTVLSWLEYTARAPHSVPDGTGTLPSGRSDDNSGSGATSSPSTSAPITSVAEPQPESEQAGQHHQPVHAGQPDPDPDSHAHPHRHGGQAGGRGHAKLTAMAGDAFTKKISTRAQTAAGKGVGKVRIRFTIVGTTDATFTGRRRRSPRSSPTAPACRRPRLQAGETTGGLHRPRDRPRPYARRPRLHGQRHAHAATPSPATSTTVLTCNPERRVRRPGRGEATYNGAVADKSRPPRPSSRRPTTRPLTTRAPTSRTRTARPYAPSRAGDDANGLLKLPKLYADDTTAPSCSRSTPPAARPSTVELTWRRPTPPRPVRARRPRRARSPAARPYDEAPLRFGGRAPSSCVCNVFSSRPCVATVPDLTTYQSSVGRSGMRALIAAATGLVLAFALVLTITAMGSPTGETSPKPLLTTVPAHP